MDWIRVLNVPGILFLLKYGEANRSGDDAIEKKKKQSVTNGVQEEGACNHSGPLESVPALVRAQGSGLRSEENV